VTGFLDLLTSMTLNPQIGVFSEFLAILAEAHILGMNCDEIARDRRRQPGMKFMAFNSDFSN